METTKEDRKTWLDWLSKGWQNNLIRVDIHGLIQDLEAVEAAGILMAKVSKWAAHAPCMCHPLDKAKGAKCLSDSAKEALDAWWVLFPEAKGED